MQQYIPQLARLAENPASTNHYDITNPLFQEPLSPHPPHMLFALRTEASVSGWKRIYIMGSPLRLPRLPTSQGCNRDFRPPALDAQTSKRFQAWAAFTRLVPVRRARAGAEPRQVSTRKDQFFDTHEDGGCTGRSWQMATEWT